MSKLEISTIQELLKMQKSKNKKSDLKKIKRAYDYAKKMHEGQMRKSGQEYITHPLNVAYILAQSGLEDDVICAALLHDTIEDTPATYEDIAKNFSEEVAIIVEGVTKLGKLKYSTAKETQIETYRKMFLAMGRDLRVILVKVADRTHNMRTLNFMKREKQIEKAKETLDIYAPIANRLGMHKFKSELEDLGFKYLMPEEYRKIISSLSKRKDVREKYLNDLKKEIEKLLKKKRIKAKISGRTKNIYSIYKKMTRDNSKIDQIYDIFALRIIVSDVSSCYRVLGYLHEKYTPMMGRFKDYIAMPKANMYQSIHTTLIKPKESPFEVQIRTEEMHKIAENGVAAHWAYKEANYTGKKSVVTVTEDKFAWVRQTIEWQEQTKDSDTFLESLKVELFEDEVYVFTPKGDIKRLPEGACPIDFAYQIHEEVGNKLVGARVNSEMVPITKRLRNGDIVEIITSEGSKGPSRDWLKVVKTPTAKARISRFFKKEQKEENIEKGKELLEREIKAVSLDPTKVINNKILNELKEKYSYIKLDDMYAAIGFGNLRASRVANKLINEYAKANEEVEIDKKLKEIEEKAERMRLNSKRKTRSNGLYVKGLDNALIKTAKCCNPVPGDEILGYITIGNGISVHRTNCKNMVALAKDMNRVIEVNWEESRTESYKVKIQIVSVDNSGLLKEIIQLVDKFDTTLTGIDAGINKDELVKMSIELIVKNSDELIKIIARLKQIDSVLEVKRVVN